MHNRKILIINIFLIVFLIGLLDPILELKAQGPKGYTLCADEGETFNLPAKSHVAYGANGYFVYLFNQTGKITFDTKTFGSDPCYGTYKSGYYKLAIGEESSSNLIESFKKIKEHLKGTNLLTVNQINEQTEIIKSNIYLIAENDTVLNLAFDLVNYYEVNKGPIFINSSTKNGFNNSPGATDGLELVRAIFTVQQGLHDYAYTSENLIKYQSIFKGKIFLTSEFYPGAVKSQPDTNKIYHSKINGSMEKYWGKRTAFAASSSRKPTGYYLASGSIGIVKVPKEMINKGFKVLVGAHTMDKTGNSPVRRFFRITKTFEINDTITKIANPFGGGIYIITPYLADLGIVDIQIKNVVPAPFFSAKTFDSTKLKDWLETQRLNPAPWADFESDKFMMQVPTSWIYNYSEPVKCMEDWDKCMDAVSDLLGYPLVRNNHILYVQIDTDIMFGGYGIGYPQVNNTYNPNDKENGNKDHWFLHPGPNFWETEFHELGHAQLFSKFDGETEAAVNLLAAAIWNNKFNVDLDTAFSRSENGAKMMVRDQAALNWMVTPNFRAGNPMDISNTTKDEVRYQHRGYGKYVEIAALFGWDVLNKFHYQENKDFMDNKPGDGLSNSDSRMFRFSKEAGIDIRPLIHFWGVQPTDNIKLKKLLDSAGFKPSRKIYDRLMHYKSIIPMNNADFKKHINVLFPGQTLTQGESPDYGEGWYYTWQNVYDETHGLAAQKAMQYIIDLYFPNGRPEDISAIYEENKIYGISLSCYPNPIYESAIIKYTLTSSGLTTIDLFDDLGNKITNLFNKYQEIGEHSIEINPKELHLNTGIYLYRLNNGNVSEAKAMLYLK
jgi:hypothetical protein